MKAPKWPEKWPFYDDDFNRMDETSDSDFYSQPRLVYHIGDNCLQTRDKSTPLYHKPAKITPTFYGSDAWVAGSSTLSRSLLLLLVFFT